MATDEGHVVPREVPVVFVVWGYISGAGILLSLVTQNALWLHTCWIGLFAAIAYDQMTPGINSTVQIWGEK